MSNKEDNRDDGLAPAGPTVASTSTMRLRAEPPRVTRLSRKVLAGVGLIASIGIGSSCHNKAVKKKIAGFKTILLSFCNNLFD